MNIFIMILISVFMVGYYIIRSPSQQIQEQETEYAVTKADLHSFAECAVSSHNAAIKGQNMQDICLEQNQVKNDFICLNATMREISCEIVRTKKPDFSYIITTTKPLQDKDFSNMLDILEEYYYEAGNFGIFIDGEIMANDIGSRTKVPDSIIDALDLQNGQLIYMTQYEIPDTETQYTAPINNDIICPTGTIKTYRFSRWQCIPYNTKTDCGGDMIWDSELLECVPDESKKPLCAEQQTAVIVDDVWECINPFADKVCPEGMIARLNYNNLEWECVTDPAAMEDLKKCSNVISSPVYGALGTTVRVTSTSCTDCELMITDSETCVSICIPDPDKLSNPSCYPGDVKSCQGESKAFYFGFPTYSYAAQVSALDGRQVILDKQHSQNRKFNCLDCGEKKIDKEKSFPPYIAICEE